MSLNAISSLIGATFKLSAITMIYKYRGFMRGITLFRWPWRCTTHSNVIWIFSSGKILVFSMIDNREIIYPCIFTFNFLGDTCSRPPITIKSHDLHASDIKEVVGEITSYHKKV
jgi:hypothetical protein